MDLYIPFPHSVVVILIYLVLGVSVILLARLNSKLERELCQLKSTQAKQLAALDVTETVEAEDEPIEQGPQAAR